VHYEDPALSSVGDVLSDLIRAHSPWSTSLGQETTPKRLLGKCASSSQEPDRLRPEPANLPLHSDPSRKSPRTASLVFGLPRFLNPGDEKTVVGSELS
jgi:hypothetical protein